MLELDFHISLAFQLLKRQHTNAAFGLLDRQMSILGNIVRCREPRFLYYLCVNLFCPRRNQLHADALDLFITFVAKIHNVVLGEAHPLSLIWHRIDNLQRRFQVKAVRAILGYTARYLLGKYGHDNHFVCSVHGLHLHTLAPIDRDDEPGTERHKSLSNSLQIATQLAEGNDSYLYARWLVQIAESQVQMRDFGGASQTCQKLQSIFGCQWDTHQGHPKIWYYSNLGELWYALGEDARGAESFTKAHRILSEDVGPTHISTAVRVLYWIQKLDDLGKENEANEWWRVLTDNLPFPLEQFSEGIVSEMLN